MELPRPDVGFGEDAGRAYTGNTAETLAALRNGILVVLCQTSRTPTTEALRHYAAHDGAALALVGTHS